MVDFTHDLEFGEAGEELVRNLLSSSPFTIEVKRDRLVSQTGNIAIEISYKHAPSGLMATTADWWAFVLSGDEYKDEIIIFIQTKRLKKIVNKYKKLNGSIRGGDGKTAELVLGRVDICGIIVICAHSPYLIRNGQK